MRRDTLVCRRALPEDSAACIALRGKTRENAISAQQLERLGITAATWAEGIRLGDVCLDGGAGYCFGDRQTGEVLVLALLAEYEELGIGRRLLGLVARDLHRLGHTRLFLGSPVNPNTRAYGFYRRLGWKPTGTFDAAGDLVLEYIIEGEGPAFLPAQPEILHA